MAKILMADDDPKIRDVLHNLLRGHEVTVATTWPEVIKEIDGDAAYDLIITDVVMPGFKDLIQGGVRGVFEGRNLTVIFISAYNEKSLHDLPPNMRFVKKPFSMRVLQNHISRFLGATGDGDS